MFDYQRVLTISGLIKVPDDEMPCFVDWLLGNSEKTRYCQDRSRTLAIIWGPMLVVALLLQVLWFPASWSTKKVSMRTFQHQGSTERVLSASMGFHLAILFTSYWVNKKKHWPELRPFGDDFPYSSWFAVRSQRGDSNLPRIFGINCKNTHPNARLELTKQLIRPKLRFPPPSHAHGSSRSCARWHGLGSRDGARRDKYR